MLLLLTFVINIKEIEGMEREREIEIDGQNRRGDEPAAKKKNRAKSDEK